VKRLAHAGRTAISPDVLGEIQRIVDAADAAAEGRGA